MADLLDNPLSRREISMPAAVPESAVPKVMDGAVYLPVGRLVEPGSPDFEALLRKNLPPEVVPDVLTNWRGVSARTSRLQWLGAVLFLLASAAFLYYFFPPAVHEDLVPHGGMVIKDVFPSLPLSSPYRALYHEAAECYRRGDHHKLCRILKPAAEEIIRKQDRASFSLVSLYFRSLRKLLKNTPGNTAAALLLNDLMKMEPDEPAWAQFHFELSPRIRTMLDYGQVARKLQQDPDYRLLMPLHKNNVKIALKQLNHLRQITNSGKFSDAELRKYREDYDLFEMKLLLSMWLLEGVSTGNVSLPDNEFDLGVFEREKALRIAMKHEKSSCKDFWQARLFIAKTLISQDSLMNHIYWNGMYHKSQAALIQEIDNCEERLKGRNQP